MMIKATIKNMGRQTQMSFPCSEAELSEKLEEIGLNGEALFPVGTIGAIEPAELSVLVDSDVSLDALNFLGRRLDGMDSSERKQFLAVLSCDELGIGFDLKNIINLTYNLSRFTLIEDMDDLERVGLTHLLNVRGAIPVSELENRERLAEEGWKLINSGKGIITEYGKIFVNKEIEFEEVFDGRTLPAYYCDPNAIMSVEVSYLGKVEVLELPCEEIALKKALARLGAYGFGDCEIEVDINVDFPDELTEKINKLLDEKSVSELNDLMKGVERGKLSIFQSEIIRKLSEKNYNFTEKNGEISVKLSGGEIVKIRENDMLFSNDLFSEKGRTEYFELAALVRGIYEYCSVYENAKPLIANSLTAEYRCLAEFDGTVLGAKYIENFGFEFATWLRSADGENVCNGNYYDDYEEAKSNFAIRSVLIDGDKYFDFAELEQLKRCVKFALENDPEMDISRRKIIENLEDKITESIPDMRQDNSPRMTM